MEKVVGTNDTGADLDMTIHQKYDIRKHNLSDVQGEDRLPFTEKMDYALDFIVSVLNDNNMD